MDDILPILIIGGIAAYFALRTGFKTVGLAQGLQNNNWLNIKYNPKNNWKGQTGQRNGFVVFSSPVYSLRAGIILLRNYREKGFTTLREVISRFAPPSENDTENYILFVGSKTGMAPDEVVNEAMLPWVIQAMVQMEVGKQIPITDVLEGKKLV